MEGEEGHTLAPYLPPSVVGQEEPPQEVKQVAVEVAPESLDAAETERRRRKLHKQVLGG